MIYAYQAKNVSGPDESPPPLHPKIPAAYGFIVVIVHNER